MKNEIQTMPVKLVLQTNMNSTIQIQLINLRLEKYGRTYLKSSGKIFSYSFMTFKCSCNW